MEERDTHVSASGSKLEMQVEPDIASTGNEKEEPRRQLHGWKWAIAYTAMLSTTFLFALDNTIVADIQPSIIDDFGEIELLPWIGVGFALGSMFILPWGKIYGVFNIKWVYLGNLILFEIGSAICGAAPNMTALIVARVITGIGGSGMYAGTMMYVSVTTSLKERAMYMSGNAVMWGVGSVLGPVVCRRRFRYEQRDLAMGKSFKGKCRMIDWIMTVVFLAGCACFTMAINFGGVIYAWNSNPEIALWAVTAILLVATIFLMHFHPGVTKENRLYPAHFLKRLILVNMQLQIFLSSGIILGDGPLDAGIRLLPFIVSMVVLSLLNGALMPRLSYIGPWHILGSALAIIGSALMYTVNENSSNASIYGYTVLVGAGGGCYIVAGFAIVQSLVPPHDIANAIGALTIFQDLGMVMFLAVSGALFQNFALQNVGSVLPDLSPDKIKDLVAGTSSSTFKGLSEEAKSLVIPQIAVAMRSVWLLFLVGAALSFLLSLSLGKHKLTITGTGPHF
ncbi:Major Facilitator Superfamily protein [Coccidioides posadasii C735 delta SOWgp]|uniref:Major Facilitator Superfamily protein n=1 Tax=Coccidioides posadasii (strain C735) TaxID=222929 RepID=C5P377_COCP7|nr:Major Facilitator Superfamily protein [Coccidioides posadasii C735 delta SOWgp]EER28765.1 Major Facilitator Superfamily protein [Coccidioides posadasii C735 delta SOWgp]|eukprot:XP_003070910.1 Major Facilitator Superfamily protein [Coccidioides posadasii C735 delta SOWgp]